MVPLINLHRLLYKHNVLSVHFKLFFYLFIQLDCINVAVTVTEAVALWH